MGEETSSAFRSGKKDILIMPRGRKPGDGRGRMGGRPPGGQNKTTVAMRELLSNFCDEKFEDFKVAFDNIKNPKEKCAIYLKAQEFVTPKLSTVDLKTDLDRKTFEQELDELSQED